MGKKEKKDVVLPFGDKFVPVWELWKEYKKEAFNFSYKSVHSEQMALKKLVDISEGQENVAIAIIEQSIADQWQGLFPLKNNFINGKQVRANNINTGRRDLHDALTKRFGDGKQGGSEPNLKAV